MASTIHQLAKRGLIKPPSFLPTNVCYEVMMGSIAYGVSSNDSDIDVYGFCIPPKEVIFPHLAGEIQGFGSQKKRFEQYQQHHVRDTANSQEYDFTIYNIVKFFQLCMDNNPNMVDALFVPARCVRYINQVGNLVRENRKIFLHKGSWHKFKGYAYSQLHKMETKVPKKDSKRWESYQEYGFDLKFAYHLVRLMLEVEQILTEGDLDLERNRKQLSAIRSGRVSLGDIKTFFADKEKSLEKVYHESDVIPYKPDEAAIKALLIECLEMHYGSLDGAIGQPDAAEKALSEIQSILDRFNGGKQ